MAGIKMIEDPATRYAVMLGALSQSTRLRIIEVVAKGGAEGTPAGEIARAVHCPASTLSFHLKELSQSGLLRAAPQGRKQRHGGRQGQGRTSCETQGRSQGQVETGCRTRGTAVHIWRLTPPARPERRTPGWGL
jgi:DNA-binding transcriptional ArsR family regulator